MGKAPPAPRRYAIWRAADTGDTAESRAQLRAELPHYHGPLGESAATVLRYRSTMETAQQQQQQDTAAGKLVAGAVEHNHV